MLPSSNSLNRSGISLAFIVNLAVTALNVHPVNSSVWHCGELVAHKQRSLWVHSSLSFDEIISGISGVLGLAFVPLDFPTHCLKVAEAQGEALSLSVVHFLCWDENVAAEPLCYWYFAWWKSVDREFNYFINLNWGSKQFSRHQVRRIRQKLTKAVETELKGSGKA